MNLLLALLLIISTTSFSWRPRLFKLKSRLNATPHQSISHIDEEWNRLMYHGPLSTFADMEQGFTVEESGLVVMVGPSKSGHGKGLYVAVSNEEDVVLMEKGVVLCGYARGTFGDHAVGDKSVQFSFNDVNTSVIFNKQLMPLKDAIQIALSTNTNIDIRTSVMGHHIVPNQDDNKWSIFPEPNSQCEYFVPTQIDMEEINATNIGMFANDLGYDDSMDEKKYIINSNGKNVLNLVWRMEMKDGMLRPTWPVLVMKQDVYFGNADPAEVGIEYSWKYWLASRILT